MIPSPQTIDEILGSSSDPAQTLRNLYQAFKTTHSRHSIQFFCHKIGINSRGHLSLMMSGSRPIKPKYWHSICDAFKLNEHQSKKFLEILEADIGE